MHSQPPVYSSDSNCDVCSNTCVLGPLTAPVIDFQQQATPMRLPGWPGFCSCPYGRSQAVSGRLQVAWHFITHVLMMGPCGLRGWDRHRQGFYFRSSGSCREGLAGKEALDS